MSTGRRPPQYSTIWRVVSMWNACSMMLLIGANPVPLATKIIGLSESSRMKNVPRGPSKRRMSFSFILLNTIVGERAVGHVAHVQFDDIRRRAADCPSNTTGVCRPSSGCRCIGRRGTAGVRSRATSVCSTITSGATWRISCTRHGSLRIVELADAADLARLDDHVRQRLAWQNNASPAFFSNSARTCGCGLP